MKPKGCKVCEGIETKTANRLILLGRSPRRIAPVFGVSRRSVQDHRDFCLVGERLEAAMQDLRSLSTRGGAA